MDQGIPLSTHDLLKWIGAAVFYLVYTLVAIYQWRHPEHVPYKWFPAYEKPGERTTPRRVRAVRISTVLCLVVLNIFAVVWIVEQV